MPAVEVGQIQEGKVGVWMSVPSFPMNPSYESPSSEQLQF